MRATIFDHKNAVGTSGDLCVLGREVTGRGTEQRQRQMISTPQDRDYLIENQLSPGTKAVHDGQPAAAEDDVCEANECSYRHPQDDKGEGTAGHLSSRTNQQAEQESAEESSECAANGTVADTSERILVEPFCRTDCRAHDHPPERSRQSGVGVKESPNESADQTADGSADYPQTGMTNAFQPASIGSADEPQSAADGAAHSGCRDRRRNNRPEIEGDRRLAEGAEMPNRAFQEHPSHKSGPTGNNRTIVNKAVERHGSPV